MREQLLGVRTGLPGKSGQWRTKHTAGEHVWVTWAQGWWGVPSQSGTALGDLRISRQCLAVRDTHHSLQKVPEREVL